MTTGPDPTHHFRHKKQNIMKKLFAGLILLLTIPIVISAQPRWQEITSVEQVCATYPDQVKSIFENLNLDTPGLEKVKKAYEKGNMVIAGQLLLKYYEKSATAKRLHREQPKISTLRDSEADSSLMDTYTFQNVAGRVPRLPDGHLKWSHNGPEDDIEWAWALNRHYPVNGLLSAWFKTGNPEYAKYIDQFVKDWIIQSWPYPAKKSSTAMWRGLEVSFRVKVWAQVFYGLTGTNYISQATKLLILSSLPDHAHYARQFHAQNNWLTMEISGLATVATAWPEFKQSGEWLEYAIKTMTESMKGQVYADGAQTELTSSYHIVALSNFRLFKRLCEDAGKSLPSFYNETLGKMYNYLALTIRPDGYGLLNNDADLMNNREMLLRAAGEYQREDWKYIVSGGTSGTVPENGPSFLLPWAGHFISRSGYNQDSHWSFFDIGPWGSGHQHNDKLNLTIYAYGRELLVDCGRFAYRGEVADKFRKYATGSFSHNVLLIDGKGQGPGPLETPTPVADRDYRIKGLKDSGETGSYDVATGSFSNFRDLEGKCKHTRTMYYSRGNFWVVVDQVATDRPREIAALWHWHPDCKVQVDGNKAYTANDRGNLQIIPVGSQNWEVNIIKGQEKPEIQGWYSPEYNQYVPSPASVYTTRIESNATFVWVLFPAEKPGTAIQTEIVSANNQEMKIRVTTKNGQEWVVSVPLPAEALKTDNQ
jgi:hypothetical protein